MSTHHTKEQLENLLANDYANYVVVGVTGHRDLLAEDQFRIKDAVRVKLAQLQKNAGKPIFLISAYAMGADQWVAECANETTVICVPLTMKTQEYIDTSFVEREEKGAVGKMVKIYNEPAIKNFEDILAKPTTIQVRLYDEYDGTLTTKQRNQQYERLGQFLAEHCDHLIALWDGIDGGGVGGTSDVVRMMVMGKCLNGSIIQHKVLVQHLHHLVVPRSKNRFPIGRRFTKEGIDLPVGSIYEWVDTNLPRQSSDALSERIRSHFPHDIGWYIIGPILFVMLVLIDLINDYQSIQDVIVWLVLLGFYVLAGLAYHKWKDARGVLLQFAYPLVMALAVLALGTIGFLQTNALPIGDSFFAAANLITLNTSVFCSLPDGVAPNVKSFLEIARILGGFLAGYIFILAFALAAGQGNVTRIKFWLWRNLPKLLRQEFSVVVGNGVMAVNLAIDLTSQRATRTILLAEELDAKFVTLLSNHRVWILPGNITSQKSLESSYFWLAEEVYVVSESDEENFRSTQEMDEIIVSKTDRKIHLEWYVHLHNRRQRDLLQRISREHLRIFSIHENTARRLLLCHPIDRFGLDNSHTQATTAQVIIVGFGLLGQAITMTCLRLGHFTPDKKLCIRVYYLADEQAAVDAFRKRHPELDQKRGGGLFGTGSSNAKINDYTFFQHTNPVIKFEPLPTAENELINPQFSLYSFIKPTNAVSLYACLPSGLESASFLGSILPRIEWLKSGQTTSGQQTDVQTFCFYNFPDPDEEKYVEMRLNSIASNVPVFCFGNFIHECSAKAIQSKSMNLIARQIGLLYACLYNDETVMDELPGLRAKLNELGFEDETKWSSDYHQANVEKTNELLRWADRNDQQFMDWTKICWKTLKEIDRESNIQAADHAWVKLRLLNRKWNSVRDDMTWEEKELRLLGEVEHRRWNAEKLLAGWLPTTDKALWKTQKATLRAQKYHYFLMTFDELPNDEKNKDFTQIVGLPYFFDRLRAMAQDQ